jgi:hypothetical protein
MILEIKKILTVYQRPSKLGIVHEYKKYMNILVIRCDSCRNIFQRPLSKMEPKRRTNSYFHVCEKCDAKRFAQKKGFEKKHIWNLPASSLNDISNL